jgi:hypothetical protein
MSSRFGAGVVLTALTLSVGCGSSTPPSESQSEPATAASDASHSGHAALKRVFFAVPKDGATIKPESKVEFGAEMFTIAPVPEGEVKDVRPDTGHFHLAVDADCLPPGQVIPKATPWQHFGKAQKETEVSLTPGAHKLTVQAGDDQHRTMEGLCETISVTVAP